MKAIVLRHGERPRFPSELGQRGGGAEEDVPLTEFGLQEARRIGEHLCHVIRCVYTSPLRRCVETASAIATAAGLLSKPVVEAYLNPEHFIPRHANEQEKQDYVRALLIGQKVSGFDDPREWCRATLTRIAGAVAGGPTAFVTHDWWMALFLANLTNAFERHEFAIWPAYLESFVIDFDLKVVTFRGEQYSFRVGIW